MMAARLTEAALRARVIAEARSWIGTPYLHQASLKNIGCDCLGLVRGVWRQVYGNEPEATPAYSPDWAESAKSEQLASAARRHMREIKPGDFRAGDLLVFRWRPHVPAKHLAIVVSTTTMIHAQQGAAVCEVPISNWWRRHLAYAFELRNPL
ncbi:Gene Transfer Agent NlpC/P60 family peptidase [hydrothermal vent metagenome]|uniref:Gene Transfer Agent NlpC/P60 family peptidase n=1 Tax=hydrothermal vent metagenome TaxID=652676 RepID=A0A3B0SM65_9ZZZZ